MNKKGDSGMGGIQPMGKRSILHGTCTQRHGGKERDESRAGVQGRAACEPI